MAKNKEAYDLLLLFLGNTMNDRLGIFIVCPPYSKSKLCFVCGYKKKNKENGLGVHLRSYPFKFEVLDRSRLIKRLGCISLSELGSYFRKSCRHLKVLTISIALLRPEEKLFFEITLLPNSFSVCFVHSRPRFLRVSPHFYVLP